MTRDEILLLQPGEELDRLVAETFEKQPDHDFSFKIDGLNDNNGYWCWNSAERKWEPMPFSTSPHFALHLWDAVVARNMLVIITRGSGLTTVGLGDEYCHVGAEAKTWMRALCLAWLLWEKGE